MSKHICILISPTGEEFYDAYGPMTKIRDKATRFATDRIAAGAANRRYGRHDDAFWNGERESRDRARKEYGDWTFRTEEVDETDLKREGHTIAIYPRTTNPTYRYARQVGDNLEWTEDEALAGLWPTWGDARVFANGIEKPEGHAIAIASY